MIVKYILMIAAIMSVIAFFLYLGDKRKAKKGKWRTPEAVLLSVGFFGGSPGALLGMYLFRHKTKHWYFWVVNWLGFAVLVALLWYFGRGNA